MTPVSTSLHWIVCFLHAWMRFRFRFDFDQICTKSVGFWHDFACAKASYGYLAALPQVHQWCNIVCHRPVSEIPTKEESPLFSSFAIHDSGNEVFWWCHKGTDNSQIPLIVIPHCLYLLRANKASCERSFHTREIATWKKPSEPPLPPPKPKQGKRLTLRFHCECR